MYFTINLLSLALVPPPTIEVSTTPRNGSFYAGSSLFLTCIVDVDSAVDVTQMLDIVWKKSGEMLENDYHVSISNITQLSSQSYQSDLNLDPLSTSLDMGVYTCQVEIDSSPPLLYVQRAVHTTSVAVNIQGKIIIMFASNGNCCLIKLILFVMLKCFLS